MTFTPKVHCRFRNADGKCDSDETHWMLGLLRSKCRIDPGQERQCAFREPPDRPRATFDSIPHGSAVDPAGFEWEIAKVTDNRVEIRIRDPYDGAVEELVVPIARLRESGPTQVSE